MKKKIAPKLIEIEEELGTRAPLSFSFKSGDSSLAIAAHVLRALKGRADLAEAILGNVPTSSPAFRETQLERLRSALYCGDLEKSKLLLESLESRGCVDLEIQIERIRFHLFSKDHRNVIATSEGLLSHPHATGPSRLTLLQLLVHSCLETGSYQRANSALSEGLPIAQLYPRLSNAFSLLAFRPLVLLSCGAPKAELDRSLESLSAALEAVSDDLELWVDRLVTYLRAEARVLRAQGSSDKEIQALTETAEIARYLDDRITVAKCEAELLNTRSTALPTRPTLIFQKWIYIPRWRLILHKHQRQIHRHPENGIFQQIVGILSSRESVTQAELFESIWKIPFKGEERKTHLRVTLSKARKLLPKNSLRVENGQICLH